MKPLTNSFLVTCVLPSLVLITLLAAATQASEQEHSPYRQGQASRDGIGKFYMGREIASVMGHRGAGWLERPEREREERTDLLLDLLALQPGDTVADIGAGTGYFTLPMAARVGQGGTVLAVDIQPEMLAIIERRAHKDKVLNVTTVLASEHDPSLPESAVDAVLMVDAYHEFSHPREVMQGVVASLSSRGRVILVEYRGEDPSVPIKPLHKMSVAQVQREMTAVGLVLEQRYDDLPRQHIMVFRRAHRQSAAPAPPQSRANRRGLTATSTRGFIPAPPGETADCNSAYT